MAAHAAAAQPREPVAGAPGPPALPFGASGGSGVLLKVTVELSANTTDTIFVRAGDSPRVLAEEFCGRHGLQSSLVAPLEAHLRSNIELAGCPASGRLEEPGGRVGGQPEKPAPPEGPSVRPAAEQGAAANLGGRYAAAAAARAAWAARAATVEAARRPAAAQCSGQQGRASRHSEPGHPESAPAPASRPVPTAWEPIVGESCWHDAARGRGAACRDSRAASPREWSPAETEESAERRSRLEALAQQVKRDLEGPRQSPRPARIARPCAGQRRGTAATGSAGERLYQDAARRQLRIQSLQARQEEERLAEEQQEATFKPAIGASQRRCPGVSRSRLDPSGNRTRTKLEGMRKARDESEVSECTFRPEVDHRSEELMAQRIQRMKVTGTLYDALYDDAMRRKERLSDVHAALPPGVTFQPEICQDRRRGEEVGEVHFWSRLAYTKGSSEKLQLSKQRQQEDLDKRDPSPDFRPKTGRAPLVPRNKDHLPIGDFLYECGRERAAQSTATAQRADSAAEARRHSPKAGGNSQQLLEQSKKQRYQELYEALVRHDPEGKLRAETATLDGLGGELEGLLRPLIAYLRKKAAVADFEQFCTDLDYIRRHSAMPSAHLFVARRNSERASGRPRQESPPRAQRASRRSQQASARGGGEPLHERFLRDAAARESWLVAQRAIKEEHELEECTFHPDTSATSSAGRACRSQSAHAVALATPRRPCLGAAQRSPSDTPRTPRTPGRSMLPTALIEHFATISAGEKAMAIQNTAEYPADTGLPAFACAEEAHRAELAVEPCQAPASIVNDT